MTLDCWDDGKPYIRLYDSRGCERLIVSLDEQDQPQFGMLDLDGHTLIGIGVKDGLGSAVTISDSKGEPKMVAGLDAHGKLKLGGLDWSIDLETIKGTIKGTGFYDVEES